MELNFRIKVTFEGTRSLRFGRAKVDELKFAFYPEGEAACIWSQDLSKYQT
jgi:hypothetical protein